jgi:hypothetical protein
MITIRPPVAAVAFAAALCTTPVWACVPDTVRTIGATEIRATRSQSGPCGCDFVVTHTSNDFVDVSIDYTYSGMQVWSGQPASSAQRGSYHDAFNFAMSALRPINRVPARMGSGSLGMMCTPAPDFVWSATVVNHTERQRAAEAEQRRLSEVKEAERRAREQQREDERRRSQEQSRQTREQQERYRLSELQRLHPRCLFSITSMDQDMARCAQAEQRIREDDLRAAQRTRDAEAERARAEESRRRLAEIEAQNRESNERGQVYARDPCRGVSESAAHRPQPPSPPPGANEAVLRSMELQYKQTLAQFNEAQRQLQIACDARRGSGAAATAPAYRNAPPSQPTPPPAPPPPPEPNLAQQRALEDARAAAQRAQRTVTEAAQDTQKMQNSNEELRRLLESK